MIRFLLKGILRDKSRSLLPVIVVSIGVCIIVMMAGLVDGMINNMIDTTANFSTGHVRIMTKAYEKEKEQNPLDLSLLDVSSIIEPLKKQYPEMEWCARISYGVLIDIPDENGESLGQAPVIGSAYDLLSENSTEFKRIGLDRAIVEGEKITCPGQVLVSKDLAHRFGLKKGTVVTLFGSDMNGSMSFRNMEVAGVVSTGISMLDRGSIIMDLQDARTLLDMQDAATSVMGFAADGIYRQEQCEQIKQAFNSVQKTEDPYAPIMLNLTDQDAMDEMLVYMDSVTGMMMVLLIIALSLVLWNTGVLGGIRRYGEFGVRLAIGESKWHIFGTLMAEALMVGLIASVLGTAVGLMGVWYMQEYGLDYSALMENVSMMMNPIIKAEFTPSLCYIGLVPGVLSVLLGTALASRAIFKRETANLFKELD